MNDDASCAFEKMAAELEQLGENSERRLKATVKAVAAQFGYSDPARRPPAMASSEEVVRLFMEQDHCCAQCGKEIGFGDWELDHNIPYSLGGRTARGNLALLCRPCNRMKSDQVDPIAAADYLIDRLRSDQ